MGSIATVTANPRPQNEAANLLKNSPARHMRNPVATPGPAFSLGAADPGSNSSIDSLLREIAGLVKTITDTLRNIFASQVAPQAPAPLPNPQATNPGTTAGSTDSTFASIVDWLKDEKRVGAAVTSLGTTFPWISDFANKLNLPAAAGVVGNVLDVFFGSEKPIPTT